MTSEELVALAEASAEKFCSPERSRSKIIRAVSELMEKTDGAPEVLLLRELVIMAVLERVLRSLAHVPLFPSAREATE